MYNTGASLWCGRALRRPLLLGSLAVIFQLPLFAGTVNLAWDASPGANVIGYKLYYGKASRAYTNSLSVGNVLSTTVPGLADGTTYYFVATAYDAGGAESAYSNEATVTTAAPPVNQPPTLTALGGLTINEDAGSQSVSLSGISSGSATESQTLTVTATSSNPALIPNPTVSYSSPNATGSLSFTPAANANGTATITVTVNDGQTANNTTTRTFVVTVNAVNDPPTLNALNNVTINEDAGAQSVSLSGIGTGTANETQNFTITATSSNPGLIPNPAVSYTSPNASGSLAFTPTANASGSATITVTINDGQTVNNTLTRTFVVTVNPVNDAPMLSAIGNLTVAENAGVQTLSLSGITTGASNEADSLTVTATSSNPALIPNPTVNYVSPNATGSLSFTPVANANGSATITVTVNDAQAANNTVTRTFTVTVSDVNNPPTLIALNNLTINEDAGIQTVALTGIGTGAANETQTLTLTATSGNPGLIPNPTVNYVSANATGSLSFAPAANANGSATITVTINDGQAANNTITRTFTVTVNPVNNAPTLTALGNLTINEDAGAQSVSLAGIGTGAANETQTLTITATSSNPALIPNPAVTYSSPNATGSLAFTPAANASGTATISVTVNDGQAANNTVTRAFTVTVNPVNDAPTLAAIGNLTLNENASLQTINLSGIGTGATDEADPLTVSATSSNPGLIPNPTVNYTSPNATGSLNFTPVAGVNGTATITVTVNDGQAQNNSVTRTFVVGVNVVNDAPTIAAIGNVTINEDAGAQTVNLAGITSGATNENQTLTVTAVSSNPGLIPNPTVNYTSPNATGALTFTPVANGNGSATITVTVNDGQAANNTAARTFLVTVNPVNDAPTLNALNNLTLNEDAGPQIVNLAGISTGASNETQTLTITATSSNPGLIAGGTVTYTSPNPTGTLVFTPVANASGTATITITVNDGQPVNNTVTRTFVVTVNEVNDAPTLNAIGNLSLNQDAAQVTVNLSGITAGATNENQTLTVTASSSNPSLVPVPTLNYTSPGATGTLTLQPAAGQSGSATITVTVNDGQVQNGSFSRTFSVSVDHINVAPTLDALADVSINKNDPAQTVSLSGISAGAANESQPLTVTATSSNPGLIPTPVISYVSPNTTATLLFTPEANASGVARITVTVNDGQTVSNTVSRSFSVQVVDNAPAVVGTNSAPATTNELAALPTKGSDTYNGLFSEESGVKLPSSGFVTVKVTSRGAYSGKLQNGGKSYSFRGTLDGQGQISSTINRGNGSALTLNMRLGAGTEADQIFGTVSDGTWTAKLDGDRAVYNKKSNPSPNAGKYTLALPSPDGDATMPVGDGYGTVTVDAGGVARFTGSLPDGSKVSQSVALSKNGAWPLFGSFGGGKGFYATSGGAYSLLLSWMNFASQATDDLNGSVVWIKQADPKAKANAPVFNGEIKAFGSVFNGGNFLNGTNSVVTFSGGAFGEGLTQVLAPNGKSEGASGDKVSLKFSKSKGTFTGKVADPASGKSVPFSGVVVQKRNLGAGFVLKDGTSSRVALKP